MSQETQEAGESELLRACLDHPDDDAPRQAYADFLHSQGDARGRFMRLQLKVTAAERAGLPGAMVRPWEDDADDLRKTHGAAWAARLSPPCARVVFVRGLVERVALSAQAFLDHAPALFALAPIRHLDLTSLRGLEAAFFASPDLARIRSLSLDLCGLDDAGAALLAASPHLAALQWLDLMRNDIGMAGARALAASKCLPSLRHVGFFGNRVDPTEVVSTDQGVVVGKTLPPEGLALEAEFGPLPWLHSDARTSRDIPPRRY